MQPVLLLGTLAVGTVLFSGCAAPSAAAPQAVAPTPEVLATEAPSFEPVEHELQVPLWVMAGFVTVPPPNGEGMWRLPVPEGATELVVEATWDAVTPLAEEQHCMVHTVDGDREGPMVADKMGPSPLSFGPAPLAGAQEIMVGCMPMGEPVGVDVLQSVHVRLEFGSGEAT